MSLPPSGRVAGFLAILILLAAPTVVAAQTNPITVTNVGAEHSAFYNATVEYGIVYIQLRNDAPQLQHVNIGESDCGPFPYPAYYDYDAEADVPAECGSVDASFDLLAGQIATLQFRIYRPANSGNVTGNLSFKLWPSSNPLSAVRVTMNVAWVGVVITPQLASVVPIEPTYTPSATPKNSAATIAANGARSSVATLRNNGNAAATYALSTVCTGTVSGCALYDANGAQISSATIAAGASTNVTLRYTAGAVATTGTAKVAVVAPARTSGLVEKDTASFAITTADLTPPGVGISPAGQYDIENDRRAPLTLAARNTTISLLACDADGVVGMPTAVFNGAPLSVNWSSSSVSGCFTARTAAVQLPLVPGNNTVSLSVSDGYHASDGSQTYVYDDATDHRPSITTNPEWYVPIRSTPTNLFHVTNPGWHPATYAVSSTCTLSYNAPCSTSAPATVTVPAGATVDVPVTFPSGNLVDSRTTVTLVLTYAGNIGTSSATATLVATVKPVLPTVITINDIGGTTVTLPRISFSISWCDPDDGIVSYTATWQGGPLRAPDGIQNYAPPGCASGMTYTWNNLAVAPWQITITATATDQQGHQASASRTFTYMAPIADFRPAVTPKAGTHRRLPSVATADTFVVRNAGIWPANYSFVSSCGSLANCGVAPSGVWLAPHDSAIAVVSYTSSSAVDGRDTVRLMASYSALGQSIADTGRFVATVPSREAAPVVTYPLGLMTAAPKAIGLSQFSVTNNSSVEITYDLSLGTSGGWGVPEWLQPESVVTVGPGQSRVVNVYTKAPDAEGAPGAYMLTASYTTTTGARLSASASALWTTLTPRPAIAVFPKGGARSAPRGQADQDVMFTIVNTGNTPVGGSATAHCDHQDLIASCEWGAWNNSYGGFFVAPGGSTEVRLTIHPSQNIALKSGQVAAVVDIVSGSIHATDSGWVNLHTDERFIAVAVSPKAMGPLPVVPNGTATRRFTVQNTGDTTGVFRFAAVCTGGALVQCSAPSPAIVTLDGGATATTQIDVIAGPPGNTGTLKLVATEVTHPSVADTGSVLYSTQVNADFRVDARSPSAGANISRDECLTIGISSASAYECGDLRVVNSLPTVTTLGQPRTPTLIYNSRHQSGVVLFPVDVTVPLGASVTNLDAHVIVAGHDSVTRFAWLPEWNGAGTRRIVVPINARLWALQTGAYQYTIAVDFVGSGTTQVRDTGTVAIVNRAESVFGAGWWLDGLEQLVPVSFAANRMLWVGGDGSTRLYSQVNDSVWIVQPTLDRPDTLMHRGLNWYRDLRDGAYVQFDNTGRHVATVNRRGHQTSFGYDPTQPSLLTSIDVPVPAGSTVAQSARRYAFTYGYPFGGRSYLSGVTAPPAPGAARVVTIGHQAGSAQIDRIGGPDTTSVGFDYLDGNRLTGRTDRRGYRTAFVYDVTSMTLQQTTIQMRGTGDDIVAGYCAAEAASLASCQSGPAVSDTVQTIYDGPRTDVGDTTRFLLTPYGAPRRTLDALGHATTIERKNSMFPLLATAVIRPNGFTSRAAYNARGLMETHIDERPLAPVSTGDAITRYVWNSASRFDQLDTIVAPTGETTRFGYLPNGDRLWQEDGRGTVSRTWFTYNGDRQVTSVQAPANSTSQVDSIGYDALLGNELYTRTPLLFRTSMHRDALGRADIVSTPIDSAQTQFRVATTTYDLFDRAITVSDSAPTVGSLGQALVVQNVFDPSGNLIAVSRSSVPDTAHVGVVSTEYTYDGAGRRLTEHDPATPAEQVASWTYDAAGNVRLAYTKARSSVAMDYDVLNRLKHRVIPRIGNRYGSVDDVQDFDYDDMGRVLSASNAFATVTRTYTPSGLIEKDSLAIRAADLSSAGMRHGYRLINRYDLSGRRIAQEQPGNVAITGSMMSYAYDTIFGALRSLTDPAGNVYRFTYTPAGLLDSLILPGGITETRLYDADGRDFRRIEAGPMGVMHDDLLLRDVNGRILSAVGNDGLSTAETGTFTYTGLGAAKRSFVTAGDDESLRMTTDAFAHLVRKQQDGTEASPGPKIYQYAYEPNSNRLSRVDGQLGGSTTDALTHVYDFSGNLTSQSYSQTTPPGQGEGSTRPLHVDAAWSVGFGYDASGRLMAAERWTVSDRFVDLQNVRTAAAKALGFGSYEEYRYDALGRRIWKRTHRDWYCTDQARIDPNLKAECASATVLTVWDGDQVLYELRAAASDSLTSAQLEANLDYPSASAGGSTIATQFGTVMYVHAGGIDRPIALQRDGHTLVLHNSWRGLVDASTDASGQYSTCGLPGAVAGCEFVRWPGVDSRFSYQRASMLSSSGWYGDMVQGQLDASGKMYMRNRYYDPATGRFTQEDPIGLAGGMSLYGYAGSDPINSKDPFGLCCFTTGIEFRVVMQALVQVGSPRADNPDGLPLGPGAGVVGTGTGVAAAPFVPNPGGRRGSEEHRAKVSEVAEQLRKGGGSIDAGGGGPERAISVGGGKVRYPDILATLNEGTIVAVQVGRLTQGGDPVARERRAMEDLRRAGLTVLFTPYEPKKK